MTRTYYRVRNKMYDESPKQLLNNKRNFKESLKLYKLKVWLFLAGIVASILAAQVICFFWGE